MEQSRRRLPWVLAFAAIGSVALASLAPLLHPAMFGLVVAGVIIVGSLLVLRACDAKMAPTALANWRDVMPCYLSTQDSDLRILEANKLFRETFGDRTGERCYAVYKQRDSPCADCPVLRTFQDGQTHTSQEQVITEGGELADFVVTSTPLCDPNGNVVAVAEMSTNITEVEALRRQLDRRQRDFAQLFDLVPCYISIQDRELGIIESNELFRRDFGDCVGERCYRGYKGRDDTCPDCPVLKTFEDGQVHSSEETVTTSDGREAKVIVYSAPVRNATGEVTAVMEVSTNITEVKELQRELALMGLAIAGMAHRVKNILMGLEGGIFVVNTGFETSDDATVHEGWEMVERNVGMISRIVKDLLYCSKERQPQFKQGVCPEDLLRDVYDLYRDRTSQENIEFVLEAEGRHEGTFDPDGLNNLLSNLVANAVDACRFNAEKNEHRIVLRCRDDAGQTIFEIEDDGAGIPDDGRHKVFENFFSTKGSEGTGLGLLVVQKVVSEHNGEISFTSKEGEGTAFRVVLPNQRMARGNTPTIRVEAASGDNSASAESRNDS